VVQETDLWAQIERLKSESIEMAEVMDGEQVYYALHIKES